MAGPNPTFASIWTQFGYVVKIWNEVEKFGNSNTPDFLTMYDNVIVNLDGDVLPRVLPLVDSTRSTLAALIDPQNMRRIALFYIDEMLRVIDAPEFGSGSSVREKLRRIRQYMVDNSQTINSRGMTIDTSVGVVGSATGDGTIRRLTVDKDSNPLEAIGPETLTFKVIRDQTSGAREYEEVFEVRGEPAERDGLLWAGSGIRTTLTALHARSGNMLRNPSFDTNDAAADDANPGSTTGITNWTVNSTTAFNLRSNATYVYRGYPGEPSTLWGLEFNNSADGSIEQILRTANQGITFDPYTPYFARVAWKRLNSATGTLTLELGSQTAAATIGSATNGEWNHLFIALGSGNWYDNFVEADINFKISTTSLATGEVAIDDCILAPMTNIGGTWWVADGGDTAWLLNDTYSTTDTDGGTRGIFSYWMWRIFGGEGWLPTENTGMETISDPS